MINEIPEDKLSYENAKQLRETLHFCAMGGIHQQALELIDNNRFVRGVPVNIIGGKENEN